jgi:hypothetical protein
MRRDQRKGQHRATRGDAELRLQTPICYPTRYPQSRAIEPPPPHRTYPPWPDQTTPPHRATLAERPRNQSLRRPPAGPTPPGLARPDLPMSERRMLIVRCTDNRSEGVAARYRKLAPHAAGGDWVIDAGGASLNPVTWEPGHCSCGIGNYATCLAKGPQWLIRYQAPIRGASIRDEWEELAHLRAPDIPTRLPVGRPGLGGHQGQLESAHTRGMAMEVHTP